MTPAPDSFTRSLIRIAKLQGRSVLEGVVTGQFQVISQKGGKVLVSASQPGKSFSFQIPASLSTDAIMARAEDALAYFDSHDSDEIDLLLKGPIRITRARFC